MRLEDLGKSVIDSVYLPATWAYDSIWQSVMLSTGEVVTRSIRALVRVWVRFGVWASVRL